VIEHSELAVGRGRGSGRPIQGWLAEHLIDCPGRMAIAIQAVRLKRPVHGSEEVLDRERRVTLS
jgi:hypothetical protein